MALRRLDETGEASVSLMLRAKEYNMLMTHCQRVEEIHAAFKRRGGVGVTPAMLCATVNLPGNLDVFRSWEAREFAKAMWPLYHANHLLKCCPSVSDAVRRHTKMNVKMAAVYHATPSANVPVHH